MDSLDMLDKKRIIFGSIFVMANKLQTVGDRYLSFDDMTVMQWFLTVIISQFHD